MAQLEYCGVLVCSDSVSAIKSIGRGASRSRQDLMHKILLAVRDVARRGVKISLMWVPAHVGILANEKVDRLAKEAVKRESVESIISLFKSEGESIVWRVKLCCSATALESLRVKGGTCFQCPVE